MKRPDQKRPLVSEKENEEAAGEVGVPGWLCIAALFAGWFLFLALLFFFAYLPQSRM